MQAFLENFGELVAKKPIAFESQVEKLLDGYVKSQNTDWCKYRFFAPCKYSRNLIQINEYFEAIVLCWDENQESPIHNHTSQNCWFAVLTGSVEEVRYDIQENSQKLIESQHTLLRNGEVGYISDDIALHKIRSVGGQACTLHIYNKPIPYCNVYDPITGEVIVRKSGFFTVNGNKQDPEGTAAYLSIYQKMEEELAFAAATLAEAAVAVESGIETSTQCLANSDESFYSSSAQSIVSYVSEGGASGKEEFSAW